MTAPDYPLLVMPSQDLYQLAHIATYIADALARHRHTPTGRAGREQRDNAVRDIAGAKAALDNATATTTAITDTASTPLPQPLDAGAFQTARDLLTTGPRWADVVSLAAAGDTGWAVIGNVPGIGPVGAKVATPELAQALRQHMLTQPAADLASWAVTPHPQPAPAVPDRVDLAAFVEHLNPSRLDDRAVARHLRGMDRRTDAAIRGRFAGVDLDAPLVVTPPAPTPAGDPPAGPAATPPHNRLSDETGLRFICDGARAEPARTATPNPPTTNADPGLTR